MIWLWIFVLLLWECVASGAINEPVATPVPLALVDGSTIPVDASRQGTAFTLTLGAGSHTISNPTNLVAGRYLNFFITAGAYTPLWDTYYAFPYGAPVYLTSGMTAVSCIAITTTSIDCYSNSDAITSANPTATAGSSAVNGSAATFMRSDAAPALPVATPSVLGIGSFGAGLSVSGGAVTIGANNITNTMLGGSIAASKLVGTDIATVGTVTAGTWSSALAATSGTLADVTGFGLRDTSAAFDVTLAATSSTTISAGRILTLDVKNVAHTLAFGSTANTITFPSAASYTVAGLGVSQTFSGADTFSGGLTITGLPTTGTIATTMCMTAAGLVRTNTSNCFSSLRALKRDIDPLSSADALNEVLHLEPVSFNRREGDTRRQNGFIAEDVERVDRRCAAYDGDGKLESYRTECLVSVLTAAVQRQQVEIDALRKKVDRLNK